MLLDLSALGTSYRTFWEFLLMLQEALDFEVSLVKMDYKYDIPVYYNYKSITAHMRPS